MGKESRFGNKINSNGFNKNPQNINKVGAPRRLISVINKELKEEGFEEASAVDLKTAYMTLLNLPLSKIKQISEINNDDYPLLYKLVAKEMLGKRGLDMLEKLLDRAIGKAHQSIDHTTKGNELNNRPSIIFTDNAAKDSSEISKYLDVQKT
jgi:hypothetical protein